MDEYAREGLRTLLFVEKIISEEEYTEFMLAYDRACLSMVDRETELEKATRMVEIDFEIVGSTAIEDKL